MNKELVSFIVPSFNEAPGLVAFYTEFSRVFSQSDYDWELIFVDDGSTDESFKILSDLSLKSPGITAIQFSRNFGKEAAIWAGLNTAKGDLVGIIDADLQQPPCDALAMVDLLVSNPEYDCVAAYQEKRNEGGISASIKNCFYKIMSKMCSMNMIQNASDFRVFRRSVADAILSLPESQRFTKGIFAWIGFETLPYPYTPQDRVAGESKWSFRKLVAYAAEGILSFSTAPLKVATVLGLATSFFALIYCVAVLLRTLIFGIDVPGYATTIGVVLLLGGIQLMVLGAIGEYLARDYIQGKQRPIFIEKKRVCSKRNKDWD